MDNITQSSSRLSWINVVSPLSSPSTPFDDSIEDSCSICLEPFSTDEPATITSCKHQYHLHCILEWEQRSKECPICWRLLVIGDLKSQELLSVVDSERYSRMRKNVSPPMFTNYNHEHDDSDSDDSDLEEAIMQQLMVESGACHVPERGSPISETCPPQVLVFKSSADVSGIYPICPSPACRNNSPIPVSPSAVGVKFPPSGIDKVATTDSGGMDAPIGHDVLCLYGQPQSETPTRRLKTSEVFTFPESIQSRFSAASARYKESFSKSVQGLRQKLLAHNHLVKELSKGVQHDMNASIARVARIVERLDLSSKGTEPSPPVPSFDCETSSTSLKGKGVQENAMTQLYNEDRADCAPNLSSTSSSLLSKMVHGPIPVRPANWRPDMERLQTNGRQCTVALVEEADNASEESGNQLASVGVPRGRSVL